MSTELEEKTAECAALRKILAQCRRAIGDVAMRCRCGKLATHNCRRVYNNGDTVLEHRCDEHMPEWLEYNSTWRPGTTQLVDGVLKRRGYHNEARAAALVEMYRGDAPATPPLPTSPPSTD